MLSQLLVALSAIVSASAAGVGLQWTTYEDGDYALISVPAPGGRYPYEGFQNGRTVNLAYSRTPDQTRSWIFTPGQAGHIRSTHDREGNFCIDAGENPQNGGKVHLWQCYDGLPQQNWIVHNSSTIELVGFGLCMDVTDGHAVKYDYPPGGPAKYETAGLQLWECGCGNKNQEFITVNL